MSVTMKDIAMLAGVSRQVVSAALYGNGGNSRISPAKKEQIQKLARELNYVPNKSARALVGAPTGVVGIASSTGTGWYAQVEAEIGALLFPEGYNTLVCQYGRKNYSYSSQIVELVSHGTDGVVILNSLNEVELRGCLHVPHVFGSHNNENGFDVGIDNQRIGYIATRHLLEHGHDKVVYVTIAAHSAPRRIDGWRQAHQERNIHIDNQDVLTLCDIDGRIDKMLEYLKKRKATALFCSNDYVAAKVLCSLLANGIRVPEDIAIIGCDGYTFTDFCPVSLTTVIQPIHDQAQAIVNLLLERIRKKEVNAGFANIKIEPYLLKGGSCGCPNRTIDALYRINTPMSLEMDFRLNFNKELKEDA